MNTMNLVHPKRQREQDISHARGRSDSNNRFWQDVHFISLPPFANLDHLGVTNGLTMFDHVRPICSCLTISWIALGDMPVSMFSSYFVVNAQKSPKGAQKGYLQASKRDPMIQTCLTKNKSTTTWKCPTLPDKITKHYSNQFNLIQSTLAPWNINRSHFFSIGIEFLEAF